MLEKRLKWIFILSISIAGIIFLQMGLYLLHLLLHWKIGFNLIDFCQYKIRMLGWTPLHYFIDGLVFYTAFLSLWKLFRQISITNKTYQKFMVFKHETLTYEINQTFHFEKLDASVICSPVPIAVTIGLLNPKIILSTGLLDLLEEEEIHAVLHHEQYHRDHRDPLKNFLLHLFESVFWYIPILKWFQQKHRILTEVMADHYAINRLGTSLNLGNALIKLAKKGKQTKMSFSYVSFADTSINYRMKQLIDPESQFSLQPPISLTIISILVVLLMCAAFFPILF